MYGHTSDGLALVVEAFDGPDNPLGLPPTTAAYVAAHDPARELREVAALRYVLTAHSPITRYDEYVCKTCRSAFWPCPTVRHIAATWSDHPDYQNRWKP